jgi:hypothetical protein
MCPSAATGETADETVGVGQPALCADWLPGVLARQEPDKVSGKPNITPKPMRIGLAYPLPPGHLWSESLWPMTRREAQARGGTGGSKFYSFICINSLWSKPQSWHRLGPLHMSFEAKRFRHVAVVIPEVRISRAIAVSLGEQGARPQQPRCAIGSAPSVTLTPVHREAGPPENRPEEPAA